jgi:hypothetical protein
MIQPATIPEGVLTVAVVRKDDPDLHVLDCEVLLNSDLVAVRDETWWWGVRAGQLPLEWPGLTLRVLPGPRAGPCFRGFSLELSDLRHRYAHRFSIYSLRDTAQRAITRLLQQKVLQADDTVNYYLTAIPQSGADGSPGGSGPGDGNGRSGGGAPAIKVKPRSQGLVLEEASLEKYLAASAPLTAGWATPPDPSDPSDTPEAAPMIVLFERDAWEQGYRFARRGKDVESAAVWTGRLLRDTASSEVFVLVEGCIEARSATESRYSVEFSGETWARLREQLDERRKRLHRPHEIILGSVHGHNFTPAADEEGHQACEACELRATCPRTTAVASALDIQWHKSVFVGQPFALLGIWGWTARGAEVWQLYGLADGTLAPRGARLLCRAPG